MSAQALILPENRHWTTKETAYFLGLHWQTVQEWAMTGKIPVRKIGRNFRYWPATIKAWVRKDG